jgi:hypothetical protein
MKLSLDQTEAQSSQSPVNVDDGTGRPWNYFASIGSDPLINFYR